MPRQVDASDSCIRPLITDGLFYILFQRSFIFLRNGGAMSDESLLSPSPSVPAVACRRNLVFVVGSRFFGDSYR
jgi:hypothetical protein